MKLCNEPANVLKIKNDVKKSQSEHVIYVSRYICFKSLNTGRWIQPRSDGSNQINLWQRTRHMQSADVRQLGIPGKIIGSCLIQLSKMIKIILKMFSYHIIIFVSILCLHEMVCVFKYSKIRLRNYCSSFFWIFS